MPRHLFDYSALFVALDAQRSSRRISWQEVARETGVAASTLVRTAKGGPMEADGVRAIVRWLGRAPEEFVRSSAGARPVKPVRCRPATRGKVRRFDCKKLHAALDRARRAKEMTWTEVAREIGGPLSPAMLTRLARGGRISADLMVSAAAWLGVAVETLTYESER